jgi:4-amino-4-deoxy-L-arabinose transferase-like glycosyltransferase
VPRRFSRPSPPLAILLAVAAVVGCAWTIAAAPLTGPDEISHFAYAQSIAETGHGPNQGSGDGSQSTQMNVALGELLLGPIIRHPEGRPAWDDVGNVERELNALPDAAAENTTGPNPAANNPPLYYVYAAALYTISPSRSLLGRATVMRLGSVALFVAIVWLVWLLASELLPATWQRVLATGVVALQPKLGYMASQINPDILLIALSTGFLLAAVRVLRRGPTFRRMAALTLCTAGAVLTHGRGLAVVPPAILVVLILLWQLRDDRRRALILAASTAGVVGAAGLATFVYTRAHSGGTVFGGQANTSGFNLRGFLGYIWQFYLPKMSFMDPRPGPAVGYRQIYIETFFGSWGSLEVNFRPVIYDAFQIMAGAGLVALFANVVARWRALRANWQVVLVVLVAFVSMMLVLHGSSYNSLRQQKGLVITGRYLLSYVGLFGVAIAWVAGGFGRRWGPVLAGFLLGVAALAGIGGIGLTLSRFYG